MSKYILIQNDNEIEQNSFELIGASTKRDEKGKVGFFGSGLKYSIAYMMRKGIQFKVFSGLKELVFTTNVESLKDKEFERICINGRQTSYTTTMGPTWTEDWVVLREIYCNALDEGTCQLVKSIDSANPSEGKTRIFIELTESLQAVIENWDSYFSDERTPLFTSEPIYTSGLGSQDGGTTQPVHVYDKTAGVLYRRGIRVSVNERYMYDYGCEFISINEDRTAQYAHCLSYVTNNIFCKFSDADYIKNVLRTCTDNKPCREFSDLNGAYVNGSFSEKWEQFSRDNLLVIKEISGKYVEEVTKTKKEVFYIPQLFARELKKSRPLVSILGMSNVIGDKSINDVCMTPKMDFLLKEVRSSLSEMNYVIHFDISVVEFDNEDLLGAADIKNKKIMIASKTFDMGRREIAMTLMEENEHILSGKEDETRAFQNHIFSSWLKSMEDNHSLFL